MFGFFNKKNSRNNNTSSLTMEEVRENARAALIATAEKAVAKELIAPTLKGLELLHPNGLFITHRQVVGDNVWMLQIHNPVSKGYLEKEVCFKLKVQKDLELELELYWDGDMVPASLNHLRESRWGLAQALASTVSVTLATMARDVKPETTLDEILGGVQATPETATA